MNKKKSAKKHDGRLLVKVVHPAVLSQERERVSERRYHKTKKTVTPITDDEPNITYTHYRYIRIYIIAT